MAENLMDGLFSEMNRVREIIKEYDQIPAGIFAATMMRNSINQAELSIRNNDVIAMMQAYEDLKTYEQ